MIGNISSRIVKKLVDLSIVSDTEQELYSYGFFILLSQILYFIISLVFGILMNVVLESVIFYISFQFIRKYAGGIHAETELKCELITTLSIFTCILMIKICMLCNIKTAVLIMTAVSTIVIFILCPLDTPAKPLDENERKYFRKLSWIVLAVTDILILAAIWIGKDFLIYPCCVGLIFESVLIASGKIKAYKLNKDNSLIR